MKLKEIMEKVTLDEILDYIPKRYGGKLSKEVIIPLGLTYAELKEGSSDIMANKDFNNKYSLSLNFFFPSKAIIKNCKTTEEVESHFLFYFLVCSKTSQRQVSFKNDVSTVLKSIGELEVSEADMNVEFIDLATAALMGFSPFYGIAKNTRALIMKLRNNE